MLFQLYSIKLQYLYKSELFLFFTAHIFSVEESEKIQSYTAASLLITEQDIFLHFCSLFFGLWHTWILI